MAIVAKKKATGGRHGSAGAPQPIKSAWVLITALCLGAALWWGLSGRKGLASSELQGDPARQNVASPGRDEETRKDTRLSNGRNEFGEATPPPVAEEPEAEPHLQEDTACLEDPPNQGDGESPQPQKPEPMPYGVLSKQYFDNPVENRLEKLAIPGRGVAMLLPNRLSQEEVLEILRRPVEIYDDDDEDTVAAKERTAEMKAEALKFIENGGTFDEFVAEMARAANEEAALLKETRGEMMRLLKEEGYEAAAAYLNEANVVLRDSGLKEMRIPLPFRRKREKELGLEAGTLR